MASLESIRFAQAEDTDAAASAAQAARTAWSRLDGLAAEAPTRGRWDCGEGCAACCRLKVFVHPTEAEAIVTVLGERLSASERDDLACRVRETAERAQGLDAGAWRRARLACAFLDDADRCRIYPVRPVKCRAHVSRDGRACRDPAAPVPLDDWLVKAAEAVLHGLGATSPREELHAAVARRLVDRGTG